MSIHNIPSRPEQKRYAALSLRGLDMKVKDPAGEIQIGVAHILPTSNGPVLYLWFDYQDDAFSLITDGERYAISRAFTEKEDTRKAHAEGTFL